MRTLYQQPAAKKMGIINYEAVLPAEPLPETVAEVVPDIKQEVKKSSSANKPAIAGAPLMEDPFQTKMDAENMMKFRSAGGKLLSGALTKLRSELVTVNKAVLELREDGVDDPAVIAHGTVPQMEEFKVKLSEGEQLTFAVKKSEVEFSPAAAG